VIVVFGSINVDLVARVQRLPQAGETLAGRAFDAARGKGANQALAAWRAGGEAPFGVARDEAMYSIALRTLVRDGATDRHPQVDAAPGAALIHVDDRGENGITVVEGANAHARAAQVPDAMLSAGTTVMMQLEVPMDENAALARRARGCGARVILNAAPAATLPATLLDDVDVLVVNEFEAQLLAGSADVGMQAACRRLASSSAASRRRWGRRCALRPSGDLHSTCTLDRRRRHRGAGDAFTAALAVAPTGATPSRGFARRSPLKSRMRRRRRQDLMPTREATDRLAATLAVDRASRGHPGRSGATARILRGAAGASPRTAQRRRPLPH
jgi:ribokinase